MRSIDDVPDRDKIPADLTGAPQTMLATLYAKALDADLPEPVLNDTYARDAVRRIDYDWKQTTITPQKSPSVTTRTAHFDNWARQFLAVNEQATVLHLGCGLDSRAFRLDPGPGVEWYDIDYPDVMKLHERLYPDRPHHHRIAASVTDPAWLPTVPADRPTLVIAEGLTMYLDETDGIALFRRIVDRFPSGELQFDAFSRFGIRAQFLNAVVRRAGATLHWGIDGPDEILRAVPGLRLLALISVFDSDTFAHLSAYYRAMGAVMSAVPAFKKMAQYHRYGF